MHKSRLKAASGTNSGNGNANDPAEIRVRVRSLDDLARKYNFTAPDEYVGAETSRSILDYGPPIVLADSSRDPGSAPGERTIWQRIFSRR